VSDHQADLDGNCERCGLAVGFSGTHTDDGCIDALAGAVKLLEEERQHQVHLVVSVGPSRNSIALSAFGSEEDAAAEVRRLDGFAVQASVRSVTVVRRLTGLRQPPAHGPDRRGGP
jgi:hypothetical protein